MNRTPRYRLVLAKEDFKFSSAHFTLFGDSEAERLHGHNYTVRVELEGSTLDAEGLLADIVVVKKRIRALCARLDSRMLVPADSPRLEIRGTEDLEVVHRERTYRFPAEDVVLLPLVNTSIELFAEWIWNQLVDVVAPQGVERMTVEVAETAGQSCSYSADLPRVAVH